ncbi:DUF6233 domain-containing protein [Streptomyces cacaoi]|uniref:DUF6233 domain-containing protein n=1 Tax=Streptomyces cacaoi TaxID=1898 RepID=UPI0037480E03
MSAWRDRAGPWARARMPDGQELDVLVTARTRTRDGRWWYECEAVMPVRHEHPDGRTEPKAAPTRVSVAAEHITPLPGEDYTAVPTEGAVAGRQWLAVRVRGLREEGPWWCVHRRDCWQARGGWSRRRITADEARELLAATRAARVCDVCRPDRALADDP